MLWRPDSLGNIREAYYSSNKVFAIKRWMRLPFRIYLGWVETPVDIREPTPIPMCLDRHLKEGYYWPELIH